MFKIGDFARLNRVSVKTLRHYDSLGLLQPEKIDDATGYRYYSASQMPRMNKILALKDVCFSLEEIAVVLGKDMSAAQIQTLLEIKQLEIAGKIRIEQERLTRVRNLIKICEQEAFLMNYDIVIKEIQPVRVASIRDFIPNYSEQGHLWNELGEYIEKFDVKIIPPCMVIYHDTECKDGRIDAEIIEPVLGGMPDSDRVKTRMLEGVKEMATLVHKGPYQTLHMAYNAISKWIEDNHYEIIQPPRELYLLGEWAVKDENEYITELQFPVRKVEGGTL